MVKTISGCVPSYEGGGQVINALPREHSALIYTNVNFLAINYAGSKCNHVAKFSPIAESVQTHLTRFELHTSNTPAINQTSTRRIQRTRALLSEATNRIPCKSQTDSAKNRQVQSEHCFTICMTIREACHISKNVVR